MRKRNKFFISCAVLCAAGLLLSVLGWVFGGRFNGIGYQPGKGLTVFSANSYGNSENGPSVLSDTINDLEPLPAWILKSIMQISVFSHPTTMVWSTSLSPGIPLLSRLRTDSLW